MKRPPVYIRMRFQGEEKGFGIGLPLFLLLPLALVLFIILSPLILIAVLVLWPTGWGRRSLLVMRAAWEVITAMRGLRVDIQNGRQCVYISIV